MEQRKQIDSKKPLISLTAGEFAQVLQGAMQPATPTPESTDTPSGNSPAAARYVYGIAGIAQLFGVSKPTAQRYKATFLQPAIMQCGRKIVTDAAKATELFKAWGARTAKV